MLPTSQVANLRQPGFQGFHPAHLILHPRASSMSEPRCLTPPRPSQDISLLSPSPPAAAKHTTSQASQRRLLHNLRSGAPRYKPIHCQASPTTQYLYNQAVLSCRPMVMRYTYETGSTSMRPFHRHYSYRTRTPGPRKDTTHARASGIKENQESQEIEMILQPQES